VAGVWKPMLRKRANREPSCVRSDYARLESSGADSSGLTDAMPRFRQLGCSALGTAGRWVGVVFGHCDIAAIRVPDCEALRKMMPERWQRVRIEFEFECRNFLTHGHAIGFPLLRKLRGRD
jgi:hypothetical protein